MHVMYFGPIVGYFGLILPKMQQRAQICQKNMVITKKYSLVLYKRIDAQFVEYTPVVNIGVNMA